MNTPTPEKADSPRSMTGFGRAEASGGDVKVIVELSSVNRRQFDCTFNLPHDLGAIEARLAKLVHAEIQRGYVKGVVRIIRGHGAGQAPELDIRMARKQIQSLRKAGRELGLTDNLALRDVVWLPGAFRAEPGSDDNDAIRDLIEEAARRAVERLVAMRVREGVALARDMRGRLRRLDRLVGKILRDAPKVKEAYRVALAKRIAAAGVDCPVENETIGREVALFAERCDISEELTRLASHIEQAGDLLASKQKASGRTLDFICQEMLREINTIGAKANDVSIARCVIDFKSDLEAAREQAQNIE